MTAGGDELKLKAGKTMKAAFPKLSQSSAGMELFYGEKDSNGIMDWALAGQDFRESPAADSVVNEEAGLPPLERGAANVPRAGKLEDREIDSIMDYANNSTLPKYSANDSAARARERATYKNVNLGLLGLIISELAQLRQHWTATFFIQEESMPNIFPLHRFLLNEKSLGLA